MRQGRQRTASVGFKSIQKEIANIGDDITSLGSAIGATASDETRATFQSIRERLDRISANAGEAMNAGSVEEIIEENPWASVAVALAVGFILGNVVRR
jgi:ElaB/YqjD/DUF883 family membrane-anchored ribosome-binding protein